MRHDWYQTDTHVFITVLIKNLNSEDVDIQITDETLDCRCTADGNAYNLHLDLCKSITVSQSNWKLSASKLEISLKKQESSRWDQLEKSSADEKNPQKLIVNESLKSKPTEEVDRSKEQKPTSSNKKNWDRIVQEFEQEEKNDSDGVERLFREIYEKGGEEVKRAMNKSFTESGGTVLSTNWAEVMTNKVDVKPPEGCEFKKWN